MDKTNGVWPKILFVVSMMGLISCKNLKKLNLLHKLGIVMLIINILMVVAVAIGMFEIILSIYVWSILSVTIMLSVVYVIVTSICRREAKL